MTSSSVVFITGVSRGLGHALVKTYLSRPNHTVIGSARDLKAPGLEDLRQSPKAQGSELVLVKIDSTSPTDPANAVKELEKAGISHVDTVIANAGHNAPWEPVEVANFNDLTTTFQANSLGPLMLFQSLKALLEKSEKSPKWLSISSPAGSISLIPNAGTHIMASYGISKAALNWFTVAVHSSNEWLIAFAVHPGQVQTDSGNDAARRFGLEKAPDTRELASERIATALDNATRETTSGRFLHLSRGTEIPF